MTSVITNPSDKPNRPSVLLRFWLAIRVFGDRFRTRYAMKRSLGRMTDRQLRDIGLTQGDIDAALNAPISTDAVDALAHRAQTQARNW